MQRGLIVIGWFLAACGGSGPGASAGSETYDSAGVSIVEAGRGEGTAEVVLDTPAVEFRLAGAAGGAGWFRVRAIQPLDGGGVVVADQGSRLSFFDRNGRLVLSEDRAGAGPGEFRSIDRIIPLPPDSLYVYDGRLGRVSVLSPSGEFVRSFPPPRGAGISGVPRVVGSLDDGTLIARVQMRAGAPGGGGLIRPDFLLVRMDRMGSRLDSLVVVPGDELAIMEGIIARPKFARQTRFAFAGRTFWTTDAEDFEVQQFAADGRLVRIVRKPYAPTPIPDSLAEGPIPEPETAPAIRDLLVDPVGNLWVGTFTTERPQRWFTFDTAGVLVATSTMPTGFTPFAIGRQSMVGVWRDSLGVEHVRGYRMHSEDS